jgi:F-type H+-transporting ATPase subunit b
MNVLMLLVQEAGEPPNVFALTQNVSFWTLVIFLLLLFVLARFAFPPILGYAAAREKRIQESLDEAKRTRAEAESLLAQQRQELAAAKQEALQLVAEARQGADKVRDEMLTRARSEQSEILARAVDEIERERDRAIESVRREAVDLAIAAAGKLIGQRLGGEDDRRLVTDYLSRVGEAD